jgi:hypothetical protein
MVGSRTSLYSAVNGSPHQCPYPQAKPSFGQSIEKPEKSLDKIALTVILLKWCRSAAINNGYKTRMEPDEAQIILKTAHEQTPERVTVKRVKIDDEVIALDVVRRAEKRFVFEILRVSGLFATSDEHKTAKGAARAGKPIWKRTVKSALKAKLDR